MEIVPRITEDIIRGFGPPLWNGPGRWLTGATAGTLETVMGGPVLATATLSRFAIEHGAIKLPRYIIKAPFAVALNAWDALAEAPCTGGRLPSTRIEMGDEEEVFAYRYSRFRPELSSWNFPGDRPRFLKNWFWDSDAQPGTVAGWFGRANGNFRMAGWRYLHLSDLPKYVRPEDRQDPKKFDENDIYNPKVAHSRRWFQQYRKWVSERIVEQIEARLEAAFTPRTDAFGTHFIRADGTNPIAVTVLDPITNTPVRRGPPTADDFYDDLYREQIANIAQNATLAD